MPQDFRSKIILTAKSNVAQAFDKAGRASSGVVSKLAAISKVAAAAGLAIGAAFGVNAVRLQTQFAASISELSAITGATGEDLKFLTEQAKLFGRTTTLSASQAAEAFKLVASAKPDLLENRDALAQVTRQAIELAEAAGITLPEAAKTVGESLNQFGAGAQEAARFVNVLAAGAKFGSSEIAQTSEALINAGVAAKSAGLSFEEANAAIQVLASAGIKGSDAGTKLRSALIKLQVQANDEFNPAIVGMNKALENLAEANLTITEKVALFGERSLVVGDILINNAALFTTLEGKVTDTNIAVEQASVRMDNLAGDLKAANSAFEGLSIQIASNFEPLMRTITQSITTVTNQLTDQKSEIELVDDAYGNFDVALRKVVATFQVIDTILELVGKAIGLNAAILTKLFQGEFAEALRLVEVGFEDIAKTAEEGFAKAAEISTGNSAEIIAKNLASPEVLEAAHTAGVVIAETVAAATESAGEQAARELAEKELEKLATKLENIRIQNLTEVELLREKLATDLELITLAREMDLLNLNEFLEQKFLLESRAQERLKKLTMKNETDAQKFAKLTAIGKTKFVLGQLQALTQGVATENKTLFRINQAAAIGNAIVNTAQAITSALAVQPFPVGLALAVVAAAAGAAQIATIASAKPGGGTTPSVAGGTATLGGQPVSTLPPPTLDELGGEGEGGGREVNILIQGIPEAGVMPAESVRDLMISINEELGDGANLSVSGGSTGGT